MEKGTACTLTRARGIAGGPYLTNRGRRLSLEELVKLQGCPPQIPFDHEERLKPRHFQAALGNAMTCSILERLIPRVLRASGLPCAARDMWVDMSLIKAVAHFQ